MNSQSTVIRQPVTTTYVQPTTNSNNISSYYTANPNQKVQVTSAREMGFKRVTNERRLDSFSAKELARMVFGKYDDNGSGYMNSKEASVMITDLYASLNENHPSNPQDGLDFMIANDANSDQSMSIKDFEDIFAKYLSTGDNSGFRLFFDQNQLIQEATPDYVYHPPTVHSDTLHETRVITTDKPTNYQE